MNESEFQRLIEISWQRPLSPQEEASLRQWLAEHPQDQNHWEEETAFNQLLEQWPDVPVASNFTSQVLASLDREIPKRSHVAGRFLPWLRLGRWQLRLAGAFLALILGWTGLHLYHQHRQENLLRGVQLVGNLSALPNPEFLNDFAAIQHLSTTPSVTYVDTELLAALE